LANSLSSRTGFSGIFHHFDWCSLVHVFCVCLLTSYDVPNRKKPIMNPKIGEPWCRV
jgi:hypothetical protein